MEVFKLPIQYIPHKDVNTHIIKDLELVHSDNDKSVYEKLFKPTTSESKQITEQWANYYTTDTSFLMESNSLFRQAKKPVSIQHFVEHWNSIQENKEFKISYQYVESSRLSRLNKSASFLTFISIYFITSPILFIMAPVIMLVLPFVFIRMNGTDLNWENYMKILKDIIKHHAIGGLVTGFKDADTKQRAYLIGTALLFCVQLYTNVYTFYTFYNNINHVHSVFKEASLYLTNTLESMNHVQRTLQTLPTYQSFNRALEEQKQILVRFNTQVDGLSQSMIRCGNARALFYDMYDNDELKSAIRYSFGFHGFVQTIYQLKCQIIKKKIQQCTFSTNTSFVRAYYPTKRPVKNSYSLEKNKMLTGPNASGKTTMLKTTLINVILSQQIGCGFYRSATICPYDAFYCYINIPDTSGRDSLFQAEARRCKEILTEVVKQERILCIFDELFSGTNPEEAVASAGSLLSFLTTFPTFRFLLTTHFFDLCESLNTNSTIDMVHMKTIQGENTYKLDTGISYDRGGVKVLEQLDYPESIVKDARMRTK
jgi:hypothetical protein